MTEILRNHLQQIRSASYQLWKHGEHRIDEVHGMTPRWNFPFKYLKIAPFLFLNIEAAIGGVL